MSLILIFNCVKHEENGLSSRNIILNPWLSLWKYCYYMSFIQNIVSYNCWLFKVNFTIVNYPLANTIIKCRWELIWSQPGADPGFKFRDGHYNINWIKCRARQKNIMGWNLWWKFFFLQISGGGGVGGHIPDTPVLISVSDGSINTFILYEE